jgi:uncharacterized membrane protein YphA (DoxX/SURF4 family)
VDPAPSDAPAMSEPASVDDRRRLPGALDRVDRRITGWMAAHGLFVLRMALGIVFFWFGALKLIPGLSPAEDLAGRTIEVLTFGAIPASVAIPILALWEVAIGLGLLLGRWMRLTLLLLFVQMAGTITPLFLFPEETFVSFPFVPTLEGQYIIKNVVLVAAAIVLGATVRGGELTPEPIEEVKAEAAEVATATRSTDATTPAAPPT